MPVTAAARWWRRVRLWRRARRFGRLRDEALTTAWLEAIRIK
jgi:hypothetical protein